MLKRMLNKYLKLKLLMSNRENFLNKEEFSFSNSNNKIVRIKRIQLIKIVQTKLKERSQENLRVNNRFLTL